ncbi:MAG TPA: 5-(carboxyamino)imidazole ribonucleotide synthase [Steroidobacteraceae bacterium]|jgi:5-(carboxyamino)imidazole ribonucleotide synthase|nr:5-(carboxyamino)imidazole ribonucleotide synthase [Steroidobacteraceae bacterium]
MTVGVVGAGQLGRMLALAGYPLGLDFLFLDRSADAPAAALAPILVGDFTDAKQLRKLARRSQVISFDWENVSVEALRTATRGLSTRIAPPLRALATGQDRVAEKRLFQRLGVPTTRFAAVHSQAGLERAAALIGLPGVVKTRRLGYDGKGQRVVHDRAALAAAWRALGDAALIYEEFVPFEAEVSALGVRARDGSEALYPLTRNWHAQGILRLSVAPWKAPAIERQARAHLRAVLRAFKYVGVLAIEFFVRDGRLIANELAPRVHNSGHWTIEGAITSQFENHLRAICGLPLGSTAPVGHAAMVNLIGRMPARAAMLAQPGTHLHDYGKQARAGRKLGHCTLVAPTARERDRRTRELLRYLAVSLDRAP